LYLNVLYYEIHNVYNILENPHTLCDSTEDYEIHRPIPGYCRLLYHWYVFPVMSKQARVKWL